MNQSEIISLVDLTRLVVDDDEKNIRELCEKAINPFGQVAAVCVYPSYVELASKLLKTTPVKIAAVINFPEGNKSFAQIKEDVESALSQGANELDVVIPYLDYLEGNPAKTQSLIRDVRELCKDHITIKAILETGALKDKALIQLAAFDAIIGGADFIKTSTGKVFPGANLTTVSWLLPILQENPDIGLKISGGIKTFEQISEYLNLILKYFPSEWINSDHLRFGSSQLI